MLTLTRIGFAARGLMYFTIGWLAISSGRAADNREAIASLASGGGSVLLVLMGLGFLAYAIWRLSEALIDSEGHGTDAKGLRKRVAGGASGVVHFLLALFTLRLGMGWSSGGGGGSGQEQGAQMALGLPGGTVLLALAAGVLVGVGLFQLLKAWKADFLKHFSSDVARQNWVKWTGQAGYAARGIVFVVIGWLFAQAAFSGNSAQAGGVDAALQALPQTLFYVVAAGFLLFGVFSLIEARYRRIQDPRVFDRIENGVRRVRPV